MLSCFIQQTPPRSKRDNSHFSIDEQYPELTFKRTKLGLKGNEYVRSDGRNNSGSDSDSDSRNKVGMPPTPVLTPLEDSSRRLLQAAQFQQGLQSIYRQVDPEELQYLGTEPISPGVSLYSNTVREEVVLTTFNDEPEIYTEIEDYMRDGYYSYLDGFSGASVFIPQDRPPVVSFGSIQNTVNISSEEQDIEIGDDLQ